MGAFTRSKASRTINTILLARPIQTDAPGRTGKPKQPTVPQNTHRKCAFAVGKAKSAPHHSATNTICIISHTTRQAGRVPGSHKHTQATANTRRRQTYSSLECMSEHTRARTHGTCTHKQSGCLSASRLDVQSPRRRLLRSISVLAAASYHMLRTCTYLYGTPSGRVML